MPANIASSSPVSDGRDGGGHRGILTRAIGFSVVLVAAAVAVASAPRAAAQVTAGDVLLSLTPDCSAACIAAVTAALIARGCTGVRIYPTLRTARASCGGDNGAGTPPGDLASIEAIGGVEQVAPDVVAIASGFSKRPRGLWTAPVAPAPELTQVITEGADGFWGLDRVDQRALPLDGLFSTPCFPSQGGDVTVFVLDTGCRDTHEDFGGRATSERAAIWTGGIADAIDRSGHGTHVAGTVGGKNAGVAKRAMIRCIKVLNDVGSGSFSTVFAGLEMAAAFKQANTARKVVVNLSLGGPASSAEVQPIDVAMRRTAELGVITVAAAGNEAADACDFLPGREPTALTVAASDIADGFADFSNSGPCLDVIAPGVRILSASALADTVFQRRSGTSMACPHATGIVALLLGDNPKGAKLLAADVARLLKSGAPLVAGLPLTFASKTDCGRFGGGGGGGVTPPTHPPRVIYKPRRRYHPY